MKKWISKFIGADASVRQTSKARQNNGITLIALVITIIVMLILVAVTITMAVNGGLFNYAGKAVGDTQNAIKAEQQLANLEANLTIDELIEKATNPKGLKVLAKEASVGDLVKYNPGNGVFNWSDYSYSSTNFASPKNGTQNNFEASKYTGEWRILNIDNEGYVYLLSDSSVGSLYLYGKTAYDNFSSEECILDSICSVYANQEFAILGRGPSVDDFYRGYTNKNSFWISKTAIDDWVGSFHEISYEIMYKYDSGYGYKKVYRIVDGKEGDVGAKDEVYPVIKLKLRSFNFWTR